MSDPTTPQPVQEPAGAVEALRRIISELLDAVTLESLPREMIARRELDSALDRLASLQPVTQAKSEAVAWQVCSAFTGTHMFPARDTRAQAERDSESIKTPTTIRLLYAAPQEAVERQPMTGWISVDDRLPDEGVDVWIAAWAWNDPVRGRIYGRALRSGEKWINPQDDDGPCVWWSPTHWMELTPPPGIGPATQEKAQ